MHIKKSIINTITSSIFNIFFLLLFFTTFSVQAELILKFGVYASDKPSTMVHKFKPLLRVVENEMSSYIGEKVIIRMHVSNSYEQGVSDLVTGVVDFARFGPASYISAKKQNPKIKIIAAESINGKKTFNGIICVKEDSPIKKISDLKGKKFAFGDKNSTIGRFLSQLYLADNSIYAKDLESYEYLGRHDAVGSAVAAGTFDAGALKENSFNKLVTEGKPLRALASFQNVTKPWISSPDMNEKIFTVLQKVLVTLTDTKNQNIKGFIHASDTDYDRIRKAINGNQQFFQ